MKNEKSNLKESLDSIVKSNPYTYGTEDYFGYIERKMAALNAIIDISINTGDIIINVARNGSYGTFRHSKMSNKFTELD